ncbi:MAG: flippase-like domain-containing protein [Gemmatimonadaceae bacterium]|nr:flippase-like domain-containing protein [Gemmatimonadaceae bacterium]
MKLDWKSALGIALSGAMLWWTLRGQSVSAVWDVLRHSNVLLLLFAVAVGTSIFPIRARRWRTILEPVAGFIPFGPLWRSTAIGMMMNNVFPFRAGEFARAYALTREVPRVRITTALGSLAVDRIFDAIVLLALMFGAMLDPAFPPGVKILGSTVPQLAAGGITLVVGLLTVCYFMVLQHQRVMQFVGWVARRVLPRHEAVLVKFVEHGVGGLAVLKDSRRFLAVFFWAALHWLVHALGLYLAFIAVGIEAPFTAALFLQGVLGIGVSIPSSPGFFGVFELLSTVGLAVYGVPKELAVSWAIGYHILSFIPITVMGGVYFARLGLSVGAVAGAKEAAPA